VKSHTAARRDLLKVFGAASLGSLVGYTGQQNLATAATPAGNGQWLVGGTNLIKAAYPATDIFKSQNACQVVLTQSTTRGPCYFSDDKGEDISLGLRGLPMQLCLQLIDRQCRPLRGYQIEVWHCDTRGVYSADTRNSASSNRFSARFCSAGDAAAQNSAWFRGVLTTDADGRVNFKTIFPGWYPGRTIHIHFAVSNGQRSSLVSQFCFSDAMAKAICTGHPDYRQRGEQDTPHENGGDGVYRSRSADFLFNTQSNADGSLLAYRTIQVS